VSLTRTYFTFDQCRNLFGDDLDPLSLRELQNLEQQLDTGLKRLRIRKVILLHLFQVTYAHAEPIYTQIDF
jgi:hypothetical protein